jgi:tetratricopeptide (TPR) repeat protein/uncharacterized caspase-like protein
MLKQSRAHASTKSRSWRPLPSCIMPKKPHGFVILLAALALTARAQQPGQAPKTWAVIVGVSKYQKLPGGQHLQFADRDAALFAEAIEKRGVSAQNVKLLTGAEATVAAIKSAIGNWLARSASEQDTVLIFFSGHGYFEREFGESYLLGYDSDPKDAYGTALSVSELSQAFGRRVHSARVMLIADAARREFFDPEVDANSARAFEQAFDQLTASRPGLSAIIASGPGEFSREGQRWGGHGAFTKHLADVLIDGAAPGGNVATTTDDLFELLKSRLAEDTSNKQRPWRTGSALAQIGLAQQRQPVPAIKDQPGFRPNAPKTMAESKAPEPKERDVARLVIEQKTPPPAVTNERKPDPSTVIKQVDTSTTSTGINPPTGVATARVAKTEIAPNPIAVKPATPIATTVKPVEAPVTITNKTPQPGPAKTFPVRGPTLPVTESVPASQPATVPNRAPFPAEVTTSTIPAPPSPSNKPPSVAAVSSERGNAQPETLPVSVPVARPEAAPSPLVLQLEAAIATKNLLTPRDSSAWDIYTRLASDPGTATDAARLKPLLAEALLRQGRLIVSGDVRSDNISDKVDEFKRAGQMLVRAHTLAPENGELAALEKLGASEALISLQFYDEAERSLAQLQSAKLASVENALGLVFQGKLDAWRAERAFKRAIELDGKWAAPHYNLALLYRSQQNQVSLSEFEAAAALDQNSVSLVAALGEEYFTRQQWAQAAEAFRRAIALKPSDETLHTKLGHALYSGGLQEEANREYQKARELRSKQP